MHELIETRVKYLWKTELYSNYLKCNEPKKKKTKISD